MKHKKIIILIVIIIILFMNFNQRQLESENNILIFNLWSKILTKENGEPAKVTFKSINGKIEVKNINLNDTIIQNKKMLNERIAPGTSGKFSINIENLNNEVEMEYVVKFNSKNRKPQNLKFQLVKETTTYNTLEELQEQLKGKLEQSQKKQIEILWEWKYESGKEIDDIQDTIDARNLRNYNFEVEVELKEI